MIRWTFHQRVGVAFPHFSRVVSFCSSAPCRIWVSGKRIFHRRNGKTTRPRSIKIEWHRGKKVRWMEIEHARGKCFFSLSLSPPTPYAPPTRHIPPRGLPCVARVKWFFAGLVPAAIFSRSAALPYDRTKLVKLVSLTPGVWYMGRDVNIKYSIANVIYRAALPLKLFRSFFFFFF